MSPASAFKLVAAPRHRAHERRPRCALTIQCIPLQQALSIARTRSAAPLPVVTRRTNRTHRAPLIAELRVPKRLAMRVERELRSTDDLTLPTSRSGTAPDISVAVDKRRLRGSTLRLDLPHVGITAFVRAGPSAGRIEGLNRSRRGNAGRILEPAFRLRRPVAHSGTLPFRAVPGEPIRSKRGDKHETGDNRAKHGDFLGIGKAGEVENARRIG